MFRTAAQIAAKLSNPQRNAIASAYRRGNIRGALVGRRNTLDSLVTLGLAQRSSGIYGPLTWSLVTEGRKVFFIVCADLLAHDHAEAIRMDCMIELAKIDTDVAKAGQIECRTPSGMRLVLTFTDGNRAGLPVPAGKAVSKSRDLDDEPFETFTVTGAEWRDDIDELAPCMVGKWTSDAEAETYPMCSLGFQVRWVATF